MKFHLPLHYAYGGLALLISIINNVFLLFYVTTFVNVFQIDGTSFYIGETLFLLWNSLNDPLFGWISDSKELQSENQNRNWQSIVLKRIDALSKFGPLFALSFLLFWFNIMPTGIQFSLALCLYDSFLTMVDLHHQALLADLVIDADERVKLNSYCSIFSAAGSVSVFTSFSLWRKDNLINFQLFCIVLSLLVCIGFHICCQSMRIFCQNSRFSTTTAQSSSQNVIASTAAIKKYTSQVLRHKNFLVFAFMNLVQVFHCHFNSNFFPLFLQHLLGHTLSHSGGALLLGLSFLVPHINNLYFLQLCKNYGTYAIIRFLFVIKLVLAIVMLHFGTGYWYILSIFIVSNRVFTEGTCKLLSLVITDLVDEDYVKFKRRSPVSALVIGTSSLLSKPGQTLAPLLGSYIFYLQSGQSFFFNSDGSTGISVLDDQSFISSNRKEDFQNACFKVLVFVPIGCAIIQLLAWHFFSLKGKYLTQVKRDRYYDELGGFGSHVV